MSVLSHKAKYIVLFGCVMLAVAGCGGPPGKAACNQFKETVIDWRQGELGTFDFRDRLEEVSKKADSAEPDIQVAAARLRQAASNVSEDRLAVSIDIMGEACARSGYLDPHAF